MTATRSRLDRTWAVDDDPLWYKDAVIYQLHVRSFYDADGDGIGDFRGLTEKLDYIQDLGVTAIWLLPFYPSPLRDEGYDIADYTGVNPAYGTMRHLRELLRQAHRRGLRVITELVINHTSDQHPWFQRARHAPPGSRWRDFYVWSDSTDRYRDARIIFSDFETSNWAWDPVADAYYWHRFYSHQPDLNYANADVRRAVFRVVDFWFGMGVDGLRLDAIPYLYEADGTSCENLPETHAYLRELRAHVDRNHPNRMLLAEANQWPEDAAAYFGDGDECHMNFHFPLMPRLFMATRMEDRYPVIDILQQTPEIPAAAQWAIFLRNHDELTLEMVTDEERDYMYRAFAHDRLARINLGIRRRLAPLMDNDRSKIELMNGLLLSLPGTPILYYGDEIGMGDNIYLGDRNGVRTPMQWSSDRNAGFSRANPQSLFLPPIIDPQYHYETVNVEAQLANSESLLWRMKRLIALRKRHRVFSRGAIEFLFPDNPRVLAFLRRLDDEVVLVVANLSRFAQYVELDLSALKSAVPVELFGQTRFPPIGDLPYLLTLGPHQFLWFELELERAAPGPGDGASQLPAIEVSGRWDDLLTRGTKSRHAVEAALPAFLAPRRWFGSKARTIQRASLNEVVALPRLGSTLATWLTFVSVDFVDGEPETYVVPLGVATRDLASLLLADAPHTVVATLRRRDEQTVLFDAMHEPAMSELLLDVVRRRRRFTGSRGELAGAPTAAIRRHLPTKETAPGASLSRAEQSNTSATFGDRAILKLFRRAVTGVNPDLELGRFLSEEVQFPHTPAVLGALEHRRARDEPMTVAIVHEHVTNEGDAWQYTLDELGRYYERVLGETVEGDAAGLLSVDSPLELARTALPPDVEGRIAEYLDSAELLGERTADLHIALAQGNGRNFSPEPFTALHQRSLYQSMRNLTRRTLQRVRRAHDRLPPEVADASEQLVALENEILARFRALLDRRVDAVRIRTHGDLHLGQVLFTGRDFVIIDFEGEPVRSLGERRLKRSAMRDVAGMVRSFGYAAQAGLVDLEARGQVERGSDTFHQLEGWADLWERVVASRFVGAYLSTAEKQPFVPTDEDTLRLLLDCFVLEKAVYELAYELDHRPAWARIPMIPLLRLAGAST